MNYEILTSVIIGITVVVFASVVIGLGLVYLICREELIRRINQDKAQKDLL
jgi:hypothetical protein